MNDTCDARYSVSLEDTGVDVHAHYNKGRKASQWKEQGGSKSGLSQG